MNATTRIMAIATKEWRLNSRFLAEYLFNNLISPLKTAILMYFIYAGFLKTSGSSLGVVNKENFSIYVLIGTTCHSLLMSSVYVFRAKLTMEKWWQTVTATLISPASTLEMIVGFILGSGAITLFVGGSIFALITLIHPISWGALFTAMLVLFQLALLGFGIGLIGATISLCWEGKSFIFDYGLQALIFLSCFYYPIDTLPSFFHGFIHILPTFHASQLIHELYLHGSSTLTMVTVTYLSICCMIVLFIPAFLFEYSLKRFGIVGY